MNKLHCLFGLFIMRWRSLEGPYVQSHTARVAQLELELEPEQGRRLSTLEKSPIVSPTQL